ncbi:Plavaka transposase-domain containing protein [Phanerochaete sordida]|uniref:Plavaka transposase-domain containing protein n=1 Tax=Phanerochaete sordida TaxID=48140 RepID=A0A9P3FXQ8_9APHY|nr:Plavaka transposase-domain containing protein [Phanerochaete sordida]
MASGSRRRAATAEKEPCDFCGGWFDPAGLPRHVASCRKEHEDQEQDRIALQRIARREAKRKNKRRKVSQTTDAAEDQFDAPIPDPGPEEQAPSPPPDTAADPDPDEDLPLVQVLPSSWLAPQLPTPIAAEEDGEAPPAPPPATPAAPADPPPANPAPAVPRVPEKDDIRVEYHPASGRGTKISAFGDYQREYPARPPAEGDDKAFAPFNSLEDYQFAEIALDAGLKKPQVDRLLSFIQAGKTGASKVTFETSADVDAAWDKAALYHPPFVKHTFNVNYQGKPQEYDVYVRDMWSWIETVVKEPSLASKWQWDAQKMSKWDENLEEWMPYWEDPSTADKMWEVQTTLQDDGHMDGKPFGIILFADKSKISSFGTQQGYPVVARIANLSDDVRNGTGFGGGRVVGFLPLVKDHPKHHKKTSWVNHKNEVWHTAMSFILQSIETKSQTGVSIVCGDKKIRNLFPFIHILSADYEEQ